MKKEYKKYGRLLYCYDPNTDFTVRIYRDGADIATYNFKLSGWENGEYMKCTKKAFKDALDVTIKQLIKVTK